MDYEVVDYWKVKGIIWMPQNHIENFNHQGLLRNEACSNEEWTV